MKADHSELAATNGSVVRSGTNEALPYGKLTQGRKLTKTVSEQSPTTPADKWTIAGHSAAKVDGRSFVTGSHQYASDIRLPGMWYGKVLRSPTYHGTLASVDLTAAKAMPEVVVVRDGDFVGVVAPSEHQASRALAAIKAEWEPGPSISDKDLFRNLKRTDGQQPSGRGGRGGGGGGRGGSSANTGSIAEGLKAAHARSEQTYTIAYIAHAPLEPRAAVAEWKDGKLTVWTGTQRPFGVRGELTSAFRMPEDRVRVIVPDTGAGYGGKHSGEAALEAARLARGAGRPVKLVWTREEEFNWAYFRPAGVIEIKAGASKDGSLTAWEFHNYNSGGSGIQNPYSTPNQLIAFHPAQSPFARALIGHWRPRRTTSRGVTHRRTGPHGWHGPAGIPAQEPQGGADARRAGGRGQIVRLGP